MTAMWAGLLENYYVIASGANGKAGQTATLTLNLQNKAAISAWSCTVVLPAGVEFVEGSAEVDAARYAATPTFTAVKNADGSVTFSCAGDVDAGGTAPQAIATFDVTVAADVEPGDYPVVTKDFVFVLQEGTIPSLTGEKEFTWTIEAGGNKLDVNEDGDVTVADVQYLLIQLADMSTDLKYDVNEDGSFNVADVQFLLIYLADHQ